MRRHSLIEVVACGECYRWAYRQVRKSGGVLVHGLVSPTFNDSSYSHAWIERAGKVYDWQTMVAHHGGKWKGKGYPLKVFRELYRPTKMTKYNADAALTAVAASRGGRRGGGLHYGPWE